MGCIHPIRVLIGLVRRLWAKVHRCPLQLNSASTAVPLRFSFHVTLLCNKCIFRHQLLLCFVPERTSLKCWKEKKIHHSRWGSQWTCSAVRCHRIRQGPLGRHLREPSFTCSRVHYAFSVFFWCRLEAKDQDLGRCRLFVHAIKFTCYVMAEHPPRPQVGRHESAREGFGATWFFWDGEGSSDIALV
jgi:hypothetical protein